MNELLLHKRQKSAEGNQNYFFYSPSITYTGWHATAVIAHPPEPELNEDTEIHYASEENQLSDFKI